MCYKATFIYLWAICLPEMRDREYRMFLMLSLDFEIVGAQCGLGPKASCKHTAALCYALEEFTRLQQLLFRHQQRGCKLGINLGQKSC